MGLGKRKVGWIGVDIGTAAVKVAQVERDKHGWRVAASAIVPRHESLQADLNSSSDAVSSINELLAARSLQENYRGRSVAATLPMSLCDVHRLERDLRREEHPEAVLRKVVETATQRSSEGLQCDFWSGAATESVPAWSQALTVPGTWTDQVADDVAQTGWDCEAIDGPPLAIARAVGLVQQHKTKQPIAALDWGNGSATLCFIEKKQTTYVRNLRLDGLSEVLQTITESLQISELEAQRLLEDYGATGAIENEPSGIATLAYDLLADSLTTLVDEIQRSCSHFQYLRRTSSPELLYLLGGGAMIRGLDKLLSHRLELIAKNWQLPDGDRPRSEHEKQSDCLLANAISLSALAWEAS